MLSRTITLLFIIPSIIFHTCHVTVALKLSAVLLLSVHLHLLLLIFEYFGLNVVIILVEIGQAIVVFKL